MKGTDTLARLFNERAVLAHPGHGDQRVHGRHGYGTRVATHKGEVAQGKKSTVKTGGRPQIDSSVSPGMRPIAETHARYGGTSRHADLRKVGKPEKVDAGRLAPGNLFSPHMSAKTPTHRVLATGQSPNGKGINEILVQPLSGKNVISSEHWGDNRVVTRFLPKGFS